MWHDISSRACTCTEMAKKVFSKLRELALQLEAESRNLEQTFLPISVFPKAIKKNPGPSLISQLLFADLQTIGSLPAALEAVCKVEGRVHEVPRHDRQVGHELEAEGQDAL